MLSKKLFCYKLVLAILAVCLGAPAAMAQLYPGDANNDGIVNNVDILYIGYAYGTYGPKRLNSNVDFSQASVSLFWSELFPDSTNFVYADTDGSGSIDFADFLPVYSNYGGKRTNPQPPKFAAGVLGFDPQLRLGKFPTNRSLHQGDPVSIPIFLEAPDNEILENVNGLAFSLELDTKVFKEIFVEFDPTWLKPDSSLFQFQIPISNRIDLAVTRFGKNPVSGSGQIGKLYAIIEDDVIGLRTRDSITISIEAKLIRLVDDTLRDLPVAGSQSTITIYKEDALVKDDKIPSASQVDVFPNPSAGKLQIKTAQAMQGLEVFSNTGQRLAGWKLQDAHSYELTLPDSIAGVLFIQILTEKGIILRKVIIQH